MVVDSRFFAYRPRRLLDWEEDKEGQAVLLRPKCGESRLGQWIASHLSNPYYRIRLDRIGTLFWKSCDGKTKLSHIVKRLEQSFGEEIEPAGERVYRFVQKMYRARLIELDKPPEFSDEY